MGHDVLNYTQTATILNIVKNELQRGKKLLHLRDKGRQNERCLILIYELVLLICKMG